MQIKQGMIVFSDAGHDQNRFYIAVKIEAEYVYIADGKRRKLEKPKRKNILHLKKTNTILDEAMYQSNLKIRQALHTFNEAVELAPSQTGEV